jgi:hypothetical protein
MNYMKKMKCTIQRDQGIVLLPEGPKGANNDPNKPKTISGMLNPAVAKAKANKAGALIDGYWIVLQTWSQCTLKCGGGKSYLQRMCVPPKEGGKPCNGDAVLNRDCNKQPCPGAVSLGGKGDTVTQKVNKPIVKIMPFSARPQRYSKCIIKESDMMYTKDMNKKDALSTNVPVNKDSVQSMQVPVRVIMNNRTLTIFAGEGYDTHLDTFNLQTSNLIMPDPQKVKGNALNCFWINSEDGRTAHLCPFGCASESKVVDEWRYDFNLFKYQCSYGHKEQELNMNLKKKLDAKIAAAKGAAMDEAMDDVKRRAQKTEEKKLATKVQKTNSVALQAVQKEINLEEMIKNEEKEREEKEEEEMKMRIGQEQEKQVIIKIIYLFILNYF